MGNNGDPKVFKGFGGCSDYPEVISNGDLKKYKIEMEEFGGFYRIGLKMADPNCTKKRRKNGDGYMFVFPHEPKYRYDKKERVYRRVHD